MKPFSYAVLFAATLPLSTGCAAPTASGSWKLDSEMISVELSTTSDHVGHRLAVDDHRTGRSWTSTSTTPIRRVTALDGVLRYTLDDEGNDRPFTAEVSLVSPSRLRVTIDTDDREATFNGLVYPSAFRTDWEEGFVLVCDRSAGTYLAQTDTQMHGANFTVFANTGALDMPWVGVTSADHGDGLMAIYDTPTEITVQLDPDATTGKAWPQSAWFETRDAFGYARTVDFEWIEKGGPVAQAKVYREVARQKGLLAPLRDRVAERPRVDWLRGAAILWGTQGLAIGRQMHTYGMRNAVVNGHGRIPADEIRGLTELGFLTGEYDGYTDFTDGPTGVHTDPVDEAALIASNGKPMLGWRTPAGVQYYFRSPAKFRRAAEVILPAVFKDYPYTARFFDVVPAMTLFEDYNRANSFDRRGDVEYRKDLLDYARSFGIVVGGEHLKAWAVPFVDYGEGNMSGPYWWKSGKPGQLQAFASRDEIHPDHIKYGLDNTLRVPLWELVFHDSMVSTWYWGDSNGWMYNVWPEVSDAKDASNVLYGTAPMMWGDHLCYGWNRNRARFLQTYHNVCHFTRVVQFEEMTSHEFLSPNRTLQRTRFANGAVAVANFGDKPAAYRGDDGEELMLATNGFVARGPGIRQARLHTPEGIVTTVLAEGEFALVDSPTRRTVGPLTAQGVAWASRVDDARWTIVARTNEPFDIDVAALAKPGAPARVARIDEDGWFVEEATLARVGDMVTLPGAEGERLYALLIGATPDDVLMIPNGGELAPGTPVALRTQRPGATVRYTLDGSEPTASSAASNGTLALDAGATVRARAFVDGEPVGTVASATYGVAKELFATGVVRGADAARAITIPLAGVRQLRIAIDDAADGLDHDACVLGDPVLVRSDGTRVSLLDVKPRLAVQTSGPPEYDPEEASVRERDFKRVIVTHAHSKFAYDLDGQYERLELLVGIEDRTNGNGSVRYRFTGAY